MEKAFTIQEAVARTGLSIHALRYYERAGLLKPVDRTTSGHRRYTDEDLNWVTFLLRLRATGMSIRHMKAYSDLRRQGDTTAKSYYSTIFEQTADQVWAVIRDFGTYTWPGSVNESSIEGKKSGVEVGAIRNARLNNTSIFHRQRLLAHSDLEQSYTYEFCEPFPYPIHNCVVKLRVTPVIDGNKAFVEWSATFDCEAAEYDHWTTYFANEIWAKALGSLKQHFSHQ